MPKPRPQISFADAVKGNPAAPMTPPPHLPKAADETSKRDNVTTSEREAYKKRPHVSLYVNPAVQNAVKQIALDMAKDHGLKRPHDVYIEALRQFMRSRGLDFDRLQGTTG